MEPWMFISFMVIVGAALGGITNALAIRMLFKPHQAYYIGKWKVPFTPGLIPKRHKEIAVQLGEMVGTYLLTAEGLEKQIKQSAFKQGVSDWLEAEATKLINSEDSLEVYVAQTIGVQNLEEVLYHRTDRIIETGISRFLTNNEEKTVVELLPEALVNRVEGYLPELSQAVLSKTRDYFASAEGKEKLSGMIEEFLDHKGRLGSMISMFMGNERLVDKVQPEILRFLQNERTNQLLSELLEKEWDKIKERPLKELHAFINEEKFSHFLSQLVKDKTPVLRSITAPLNTWMPNYEERIIQTWIPNVTDGFIGIASKQIGHFLKAFQIEQVISNQVLAFSTKYLEELVMSVASKELKLITYLGALIGGVVGLFQGLFVLLINSL
ncbi:DUF445 domain-containing protein [Alkalicoccobacillus gibsonii]|uniref:DUF445 domain-containing protein n=1 Tax=Alkalicoccobacillus gibsonii TaxID=79881 RepID=UPI00193318F8|nr:DUF445 family protein [Alkalicoccobacillus gibsonii]MBM0064103.1 DUF445 domain-containing protein [Alkalicoccobacillus gibsonii]